MYSQMSSLKSYLPQVAAKYLHDTPNAILIDVRSAAEYQFVGHPLGSVLVPWLDVPEWQANPQVFIERVEVAIEQQMGAQTQIKIKTQIAQVPLMLICRSGIRSADAGRCLLTHGFTQVGHVSSGFEGDLDEHNQRGALNGWRFDGLDWSQN